MRRVIGFVLGAMGVLALTVYFLAPSVSGERAVMAERADYGSSRSANPRSLFLVGGAALLALAGVMTRR